MARWLTRILTLVALALLGVFPYALARLCELDAGLAWLCAGIWFFFAVSFTLPDLDSETGEYSRLPIPLYIPRPLRLILFEGFFVKVHPNSGCPTK